MKGIIPSLVCVAGVDLGNLSVRTFDGQGRGKGCAGRSLRLRIADEPVRDPPP